MKISTNNNDESKFEPCPEHDGPGVCVDITELKTVNSTYGERQVFRIAFETTQLRQDGRAFLVYSRGFTPSLHEKSALRGFLRQWFGRDLTSAELAEFDTETLVGRPARISVVHSEYNGNTYANIGLIRPDKSGEPLAPSGKYVRQRDRAKNDAQFRPSSNSAPQSQGKSGGEDWRSVKIHVGRHKGLDLGELDRESVQALLDHWLPTALEMEKPLKADRELIAALQLAAAAMAHAEDHGGAEPF